MSECVAVYDRGSITLSPVQFPHADVDLVLGKLVGPATGHTPTIQAAFREGDPAGSGHTSLQQFTYVSSPLPPHLHYCYLCMALPHSMVVKGLSQGLLSEHESQTLGRAFGQRAYPILPSLVRVVQDHLRQHNYTQFPSLEAALAECCQVQ